ncbi:MAG TPA: sensor domain-containing diguanylate cyclase [Solirubrobacteraceae bacterium]|jgi:diguanylate cyclase (GGDEF)-like protein
MPDRLDTDRLLAIVRIQNEIAGSPLALDDVMGVVVAGATELTGADAGVVELVEGDEMVYRAACGTAAAHVGLRLKLATSLSGLAVRDDEIKLCDDAREDPRVDAAAASAVGAVAMVCVPLRHHDRTAGVLKVYASRPRAFGEQDVATLSLLSGVIGAHLTHAAEYERREHESRHDPLTDVGNRRAYDERLVKEVARACRYGRPLSLVLLDLDGFKAVNDRAGHPAGDEVLRRVAAILRATRVADDCYRLGGDEFALLLPDTPPEGAALVAERVAAQVRAAGLGGGHGQVTVSYGVASCGSPDALELHRAADERLLQAKRALGASRR